MPFSGASGWFRGKESACQFRRRKRHGFDPWVTKIPGEGNNTPLQYSWLGNKMDRGDWQATVHRVTKSRRDSNYTNQPTPFSSSVPLLSLNSCFLYLQCYAWLLLLPNKPDRMGVHQYWNCIRRWYNTWWIQIKITKKYSVGRKAM